MAYENKTVEEVRDLIINSVKSKFNLVFRILSKSFIKTIAVVFSGVFIICYKQIGWLFLQLFPETASWKPVRVLGVWIRPLVKWGILIGVGEPYSGSQWKGTASVTVIAQGGSLPAGTQLKSDVTGKLYITEEGVLLEAETAAVPIICAESGSAGNLEAADTLSFVNPLGTVDKQAAVLETASYAEDDETESSYRARVVSRFRSPPLGGAFADYHQWASDVPGVLNTYPYKETETASGVLLYVSGIPSLFPDRIPSAELLKAVGDACTYDPKTGRANRKPITAVIDPAYNGTYDNVRPVSLKLYDVYITGMKGVPVSDFALAARPALDNYFTGREPYIRGLSDDNHKANAVSKNSVSSVVDQTAVSLKAEFDSVILRYNGADITSDTLGMGQLCKMNALYVNGVQV
jgi:uncharacterized phage protein gp47/JayE